MNPFTICALIYNFIKVVYPFSSRSQAEQFENDFNDYVESIEKNIDEKTFLFRTSDFISRLNCHHTRVEYLASPDNFLPFELKQIGSQWVVVASQLSEIAKGDVLSKVNNIDVDKWVDAYVNYSFGASIKHKEIGVFRQSHLISEIHEFEFESSDGRKNYIRNGFPNQNLPLTVTERLIHEGLLYLRVDSFDGEHLENSIISKLQKHSTKGLIIDLRFNSGGTTPVLLLDYLMNKPYVGFDYKSSMALGIGVGYEKLHEFISGMGIKTDYSNFIMGASQFGQRCQLYIESDVCKSPAGIYNGQIAVLISELTASAAEDFVFALQQTKRAKIFGTKSKGATGQAVPLKLNENLVLWASARRAFLPGGQEFKGIEPDFEIVDTKDSLVENRDPQLEAALNYLRSQLAI